MGKLKVFKYLLTSAIMTLVIFVISSSASAADGITVTVPTDRAIYQRDCDNHADITVTVNYAGDAVVEAQVLNNGEVQNDWSELSKESGDVYTGVIPAVQGGGWYTLSVRAKDKTSGEELANAEVERFGVGEVFITGGQSNSANFGGAKMSCEEDIVSAFDSKKGTWQHCEDSQPNYSGWGTFNEGGSPWPTLGDELVAQLNVPIGFISTGFGGSKISELLSTHYQAIKDAIDGLKPYGYKAFLIHQGEADANTARETYKASYMELINTVRNDAGFDLPWIIAKVAYSWSNDKDTNRQKTLTDAQKAICNNYNIFEGPTTDDLQGDYRYTDNLHLSEKGLIEHGKRWAAVIMDKLFTGYAVKVAEGTEHGTFEEVGKSFYATQNVRLTAVPDDGYYLVKDSVQVDEGAFEVNEASFNMPAQDVTVTAEFAKLPQHLLDLGAVIKSAESLDLNNYIDSGKDKLSDAIVAARLIYSNPSATQQEAEQASSAVLTARAALVVKAVATQGPSQGGQAVQGAQQVQITQNVQTTQQVTPVSSDAKAESILPEAGTVIVKSGIKYKVTASSNKLRTVAVYGLKNKAKSNLTIPASVTIKGAKYKVTAIAKKAFFGAKKLKVLTIKSTTIKSVGKNAFKGVYFKVKIKVPASRLAIYKKMLKGMKVVK